MTTPRSHVGQHDSGARALDLATVMAFLRRGALMAIGIAAVAGASAYLISRNADPVYRASIVLVASSPGSSFGALDVVSPPRVDPTVYRSALLEGTVVADALTALDGRRPSERELEAFVDRMTVTIENQDLSSVIRIELENADPVYASDVANAIAQKLMDWDRDRARSAITRGIASIERSLEEIDAELATTTDANRLETLRALRQNRLLELEQATSASASAVVVGLLEPLRLASPPEQAVGPRVVFSTFVAIVLGLVVGYGLLFVQLAVDSGVTDRDAAIALTGLPVFAEFARRSRRANRLSGEMASFFRTNLTLATQDAKPRIVVITSASEAVEKDGVAVSLAESFARGGSRTLLVDADLRHPGTTAWLDVVPSHAATLEAYLADPGERHVPVNVAAGIRQTFDFIPSFTTARFPVDLLNQGLPGQLDAWRTAYDVIILDAPPVLPFADALAIAPLSTGVVLCASARHSKRDQVLDAVTTLERGQIRLLGVVLTNLPMSAARRRARGPSAEELGATEERPHAAHGSARTGGRQSSRSSGG
jgi:Mrp family chromosome partitioning ATPase